MLEFFTIMITLTNGVPTEMVLFDTEGQCEVALLDETEALCAVTTHIFSSPRPQARPTQ